MKTEKTISFQEMKTKKAKDGRYIIPLAGLNKDFDQATYLAGINEQGEQECFSFAYQPFYNENKKLKGKTFNLSELKYLIKEQKIPVQQDRDNGREGSGFFHSVRDSNMMISYALEYLDSNNPIKNNRLDQKKSKTTRSFLAE